jgi:CubicO group peptidase (beta-lactamase class C family)
MTVHGTTAKHFGPVREAFANAQANDPGGAQLCIYRHGEVVVDLWTGRDIANDRPYAEDTLTVLMSCTKGAVAICAGMLAERGLLDVEAPVAKYWPEFAANGKAHVTVAHCLSHTAGLPTFPIASGITARDFVDWDKCIRALAEARPLWAPGAYASYHAVTYGFLVGEVIRRITGKSFGTFFADEVARPLGLEFWIGLPEAQQNRVAPHIPQLGADFRALMVGAGVNVNDPIMIEILAGFDAIGEAVDFFNTPVGRAAELPAGNGVANARSLARMYAACIGEINGVQLLNKDTLARAMQPRTKELPSLPPLAHLPRPPGEGFGLGFALGSPVTQMLGPGSFGHDGAGGRLGFAHPQSGVAAGFACNSMLWDNFTPDPRWSWVTPLREIVADHA